MSRLYVSALACAVLLSACDDDSSSTAGADAGVCAPAENLEQPRERFPAGETIYLARGGDCGEASWALTKSPPENANAVMPDGEARDRFTPVAPGSYSFALGDTGRSARFEVVDPADWPFHNHNYYPTRSVAVAGGAVWVADALTPSVSVLDPDTLEEADDIRVGSWPVAIAARDGSEWAVVAQRGSDTLGVIDVAERRLVDAVWVGDEPSNVVLHPDEAIAYVTLATEAAVVAVDLEARRVTGRVEVGVDPHGLAISPDGARLYVASRRSGMPDRFPYATDPVEAERDVSVVDTATLSVVDTWLDRGTTHGGLAVSPDGATVYSARTRNSVRADLADPDDPSFIHEVAAIDAASGDERAAADLLRQESSGGHAVSLHGLVATAEEVWVVAESSDLLVRLDAETLAEVGRVEVLGRPRGLALGEGVAFVHGVQAMAVHRTDGASVETGSLGDDPRPEAMAAGQRYFTGAGRQYGANWSCNSCHLDGLTDTLTWNAGPFVSRYIARPFFWLEGTWPLGWAGYLSDVENYAYTVNTNIGIRPTTAEAKSLTAYLSSIMPPPAANAWTRRDGALSEAGLRGKAVYEGEAGCTTCHGMPLSTGRATFEEGITAGQSDTPALVGIYRSGTWLKNGEAQTLRDAASRAASWLGSPVEGAALDDLTRYLHELTGRDFFVLTSWPRRSVSDVATTEPVRLAFSLPVWPGGADEAFTLFGPDGPVAVSIDVDGRHVEVRPDEPLDHLTEYTLEFAEGLSSYRERALTGPKTVRFTTAAAPSLALAEGYRVVVDMPAPKPDFSGFDREITLPTRFTLAVTPDAAGGRMVVDYGEDLLYDDRLTVSGDTLRLPPLPIPIGPSFSDSFGAEATLVDEDGDGVADVAEGTLTIAGPGFEEAGVTWRLESLDGAPACPEGPDGEPPLTVDRSGDVPVISWEGDEGEAALALYVTDPGVNLPLGPGQTVTGGETYWGLATIEFPGGFQGPVTYGVVPEGAMDNTEANGGPPGGAELEEGKCYQFAVITNRFKTTTFTLVY